MVPKMNSARRNYDSEKPKKLSSLRFTSVNLVDINKDYGLIRTSNKSMTPYPRIETGVDANLLKARLSMRQQIELRRSECPVVSGLTSRSSKFVSLDLSSTPSNVKDMLSLGTPHPIKSVALNAKVLARRLTEVNEALSEPDTPLSEITPGKKVKRMVRLMGVTLVGDTIPDTSVDWERLPDLSPRITRIDYNASESQSKETVKNDLSFAERRKLFDEGEFTIAKSKSLNDVMMASAPFQHTVADQSVAFARKAREEIQKYAMAQGLTRNQSNILQKISTWSSKESMSTHSMAEIYQDIKIRNYTRSPSPSLSTSGSAEEAAHLPVASALRLVGE